MIRIRATEWLITPIRPTNLFSAEVRAKYTTYNLFCYEKGVCTRLSCRESLREAIAAAREHVEKGENTS